jgi:predicted nucleic acid-binding protein
MLDAVLSAFPTIPIDLEVCQTFGRERGRLRRDKLVVADFDLLIASTCLRWELTLLTNNRRHYELVKGLKILSL